VINVFSRIQPEERARFSLLGLLLFVNSMIFESNEVVATSGFLRRVGTEEILWVWAADMFIVIVSSGAYSLVIDRHRRHRLILSLLMGFSVAYMALYVLFLVGAPDWLPYSLLSVINDQHWLLVPMVVWALANDLFSVAEAKRIFPLLAMVAFAGGVAGNAVTAAAANLLDSGSRGSIVLLAGNAVMLLLMAAVLALVSPRLRVTTHQAKGDETLWDAIKEGIAFVREVPSYRYLTVAMVLLGVGLNTLEYQFVASAAQAFSEMSDLESFFAMIKAARIVIMVVVQGAIAGWMLQRLGLKSVFGVMPAALLTGLMLAFLWPGLIGVVIGEYLGRITLAGVDEPSRRAFVGLVPDERRGRVSAFMDGYLYPLGSFLGCGIIGGTLFMVGRGLLSPDAGHALYFGLSFLCALGGLWAIWRFRAAYDTSMLNWRLKRRRRGSILADLNL
jgi:ATP:ADP antiporter, AAA family